MTNKEESKRGSELNKAELNMGEVQAGISLTSFMTVVGFFFIGLLLTGSESLQFRLRVPLAFLFVSAFGFLYSTLVYANASGEIARLNRNSFSKQMCVGNVLSEYLGVYCLAISAPLAVLGYSPDTFLAVLVFLVSSFSWLLYHHLGFSILERYLKGIWFRLAVTLFLLVNVVAFVAFYLQWMSLFYCSATLLAFLIMLLTVYSLKRGEG